MDQKKGGDNDKRYDALLRRKGIIEFILSKCLRSMMVCINHRRHPKNTAQHSKTQQNLSIDFQEIKINEDNAAMDSIGAT